MHHFYLHWWKKWWFQANCDYDFSSILVGSPYHARFQLWIVQVVSKERHTKQLMSTTERKQHEMAHYLSPSIHSLYIFWPLSSANLLSIPFICIPIYISYVILYELQIWKSDEVPETAPEPRILQICKKHLKNGGCFPPVTWTGVPDWPNWHGKPRYHLAACWTQQLKWSPALLKDLGQVSPPVSQFSVPSLMGIPPIRSALSQAMGSRGVHEGCIGHFHHICWCLLESLSTGHSPSLPDQQLRRTTGLGKDRKDLVELRLLSTAQTPELTSCDLGQII